MTVGYSTFLLSYLGEGWGEGILFWDPIFSVGYLGVSKIDYYLSYFVNIGGLNGSSKCFFGFSSLGENECYYLFFASLSSLSLFFYSFFAYFSVNISNYDPSFYFFVIFALFPKRWVG